MALILDERVTGGRPARPRDVAPPSPTTGLRSLRNLILQLLPL